MKRHLIPVIILIFINLPLTAQKTKDVLYLKNGSKIYGNLMEISDNQYKIKTSDGSLFIYSQPEVEKFINEATGLDGRKKNGLGFALEAGFMVGAQSTEYVAPFSFNYLGNYVYNTKDIFGLGSGVEYVGQPFMPLFLEYKRLMTDRKTAPFIFLRSGWLFHLKGESDNSDNNYSQYDYSKSYEGGFTFTMGTGVSWARDDIETYLSFAYRNAHTSYSQMNYNNQYATYKNTLNRLEIKFGFRF